MSESMSYELSRKLNQRGYEGQMALGYLDAINDLMKIEDRRYRDQPTINENQQIVLEWLKKEYAERNLFPTEVAWLLFESIDNGYLEPEEERAFENLNKLQEAQVLQAFSTWAIDQCKQ